MIDNELEIITLDDWNRKLTFFKSELICFFDFINRKTMRIDGTWGITAEMDFLLKHIERAKNELNVKNQSQ